MAGLNEAALEGGVDGAPDEIHGEASGDSDHLPAPAPVPAVIPTLRQLCLRALAASWTSNARAHMAMLPEELADCLFAHVLDTPSSPRAFPNPDDDDDDHEVVGDRHGFLDDVMDLVLTPQRESLTLDARVRLRDPTRLLSIPSACPSLRALSVLNGVSLMAPGTETYKELPVGLPSALPIDSAFVTALAEGCSNLAVLKLPAVTEGISRDALRTLLSACTALTTLVLSLDDLGDDFFADLGEFSPPLRHLTLNSCKRVSDAGLAHLALHAATGGDDVVGSCPDLEHVYFGRLSKVTDAGFGSLVRGRAGLRSLGLESCVRLRDASLALLAAECPQLEALNLASNARISDDGLDHLAPLSFLRSVNLSFCDGVTDAGIAGLCANHGASLTSLNLSFCRSLTPATLVSAAPALSQLRSIVLAGGASVSDAAVEALAAHCPFVEELNLWKCEEVTSASIAAAARAWPNLASICLADCNQIDDEAMTALASASKLTNITIGGWHNVTDAGVGAMVRGTPDLQVLGLMGCTQVTAAGFADVAAQVPHLRTVNLFQCRQLDDDALLAFAVHCPGLLAVDVAQCALVTEDGIRAFLGAAPGLAVLSMNYISGSNAGAHEEMRERLQAEFPAVSIW